MARRGSSVHVVACVSDDGARPPTAISRADFHKNLEWVAANFADQVAYDAKATAVTPLRGPGLVPGMPDGFVRDDHVRHIRSLPRT